MSEIKLQINNLNKSFGSKQILKDLNFTVESGEFLPFLGVGVAEEEDALMLLEGRADEPAQLLVEVLDPLEPVGKFSEGCRNGSV